MAYTLQAIVAKRGVLEGASMQLPRSVGLGQDILMVPLSQAVRELFAIPSLPLTDEGEHSIPPGIVSLCVAASANGRAAYIEAEFFGGEGMQAVVLAERGEVVGQALVSLDAINSALEFLGVARAGTLDEFDAVGLGKQRDTDDW